MGRVIQKYPPFRIDVYSHNSHHYVISVAFPKKWQAILFHKILNKSRSHTGSRNGQF